MQYEPTCGLKWAGMSCVAGKQCCLYILNAATTGFQEISEDGKIQKQIQKRFEEDRKANQTDPNATDAEKALNKYLRDGKRKKQGAAQSR